MSITQLLNDLADAGIKLSVAEGQLKLRAPKGSLTAELRSRLSDNKQALLDLLSQERAGRDLSVLPQIIPDPDSRHLPFPLTDIQQAYWIGSQTDMDFGAFGIHIYTEIDCTDLDLDRFTTAVRRLIARHDMLRAVVDREGQQRILASVPPYEVKRQDLRERDQAAREQALELWRERLSHSHRDAAVWPGFEIAASLIDPACTRLHFSIDLLHVDGGSLQLLFRDLVAYYQDDQVTLPELQLSYRDYVMAEQKLHQTEMYQRSLDYWRGHLPDLPAAPQLPTVTPEEGALAQFHHDSAIVPAQDWSRIKTQIKRLGFSPPAVLLTAFAEALACWSREKALTVNVTVFNRLPVHAQVGEILGDFTSMVLLGMRHQPEDSFATRAKRVQERLWGAFEHRHVSGVRVLRELARVRGSAQAAMMPVVFTSFLNLEDDGSSVPSSAMRALGDIHFSQTQTPQVWLDHQVIEDSGMLLLSYDMMENIFPKGMIPALFEGYRRLLAQLAEAAAWERVPTGLIEPAELARHAQINQTQRPIPPGTLYDRFCEQVHADGRRIALITANQRFSYGELFSRANRLGHWLLKHGAVPDKLVAVVMEKGYEQVLAVFGILAAGAAYLPVDPDLPAERLSHILKDGDIDIVLTTSKLDLDLGVGRTILALDTEHETEALPETRPQTRAGAGSLAYVLYTSGSTGQPKGVMIEHRSVINRMSDVAERWRIGPGDRALGVSALHHDLSVFDLFGVLTAGATLVLPSAAHRLDPDHWADLMVREQVTLWNSVPTFLAMLVDFLENAEVIPDRLRWVILAGDWIPVDLPTRLRALLPELTFIASGGPTETTVWDIYNPVTEVDPGWSSIPYGKPLANAHYYILDDHLQPCPTWVPGEMCIGGAGLARGYWNNPTASEAFFKHPITGERLYRSGDLGRILPDGNIEILGRKDFQVKIRGMRIELGEVESILAQHPAVKQAVVQLCGARFGNQRLVAYMVRAEGADEAQDLLEEELRAFLNEKLPPYMVPGHFMSLERLPMGATGKVDRKALPTPESAAADTGVFTEPRTETEGELAALWAEALGLETLSVEANLIDLGLNSLMAIQVNGKLRERFGHELPLRLLLDAPTIAGLARALDELLRHGQAQGVLPELHPDPAQAHEPFQLNQIQQAYWMGRLDTFELGGVAAQYYLEFEIPPVDMARVNQAWNAVIARHPMLRAHVRSDGRQQVLAEIPTYEIELLDMRGWSFDDADKERMTIRERMAHQVLDPQSWPLFEFRATQTRDDVVRFHFHLDLLVADAWSAQIIFADFRRFMETEAAPTTFELSFRDYLLADASMADSPLVAKSRDYWFARLDSLPGAPTLPLAKQPGSLDKHRFVRRSFRLPVDVWAVLKRRATDAGVTPSGLLLTAFGEVLAHWSRVPHLCINVTTFRRLPLHSEINAIVGDFTSLTLLEVDCRAQATFENRVRTVQERLFQDLDHRYFSGVDVVRRLAEHQGRQPGALMPVVFTSLLTRYEDELAGGESQAPPVDEVFALSQTPQVWLDHQVIEEAGALVANWDAVEELFYPGLLDQMLAAYKGLLIRLAGKHETWHADAFGELPSDQMAARVAYNQTELTLPSTDLYRMFATTAEAAPDRPALICSAETLSYAQLQRRANRIGNQLQTLNLAPGEMVAVIADKGWPQVAAVLGILAAGGAYLPIDPQWPEERRNYVMDHAGAKIILTELRLEAQLNPPGDKRTIAVDGEALRRQSDAALNTPIRPDQLAYAIFTSGSTGRPKGVTITHEAAANTILDINRRFAVSANDRVLALSSLSFDLSVYDLFGIFAAGGAMVLPDPGTSRDPAHWLEMMDLAGVSLWNTVPALLELLLDYTAQLDGPLPGKLRLALLSGDWLPLDIAARLRRHQPEARVISLGGATEASIWSIFHEIEEVEPSWKSIPYGAPLANQRFYVLDAHHRPCPMWVPGELYIAGRGLARDYLGEPEKTAASFVTYQGGAVAGGPQTGERLYRTGDWGRFQAGNTIEFLGRRDEQVKIQGFRIELGEVEHALLRCSGVASAVALVLGDSRENRRLVAACVPEPGITDLEAEALRAQAGEHLPDYMVPTTVAVLESLPLTANGKIDRKALLTLGFADRGQAGKQAPRTPLEIQVSTLWCELLELSEPDVHTTLFEAGGNSLVAIRLLAALQETFAVDVSLQSLFEHPTIAGLAEVIGRLKAGAGESGSRSSGVALTLVPQPDDHHKPFPLSDIQQAYLLGRMDNLELGGVAAHAYFEVDINNGDPERIQQVWRRLITRHDMLRAVFKGGEQMILKDPPPFELPINDLRDHGDEEIESFLNEVRAELSHQVLPTDQWPLFDLRASLLPDERMRVHISFDLLIADAWSSQILFTEMGLLARNPDLALPALEINFRDYMTAMQGLEETDIYQRSRSYWRERLPELPAAPDLPLITDPATMAAPVFTRRAAALDAASWQQLQRRATDAGLTASGVCLAAYAEVLAAWSGSPRFTINVTTFNRLPLHPGVHQLVGDFTSLTLLAVDAAERGSFQLRARGLQERLWQDLDHRHYSGIQVVRDLARMLGRSPGALMPVVYTSRLFSGDHAEQVAAEDNPMQGAEWVYSVSQTPQVWLDMQISEEADGTLAWTWDAVEALFPEGLLQEMFEGYRYILQQLADDPAWWASEALPLLPTETRALYAAVNRTELELPPCNLYALIAPQWHRAEAKAVLSAGEALTYGELDALSSRVTGWLHDHGAQADERVAIIMEKGWEQVVAATAVAASHGAYVPIDPQWPQERILLLLEDAGVRLVLSQPKLAAALTWPEDVTLLPLSRENLADLPETDRRGPAAPNDLAYVIFTSGTTGRPKGVAIEHGAAANTLRDINQRFQVGPADRVLGLSALTFDLSVYDVFGTLAAGAALVLPEPEERREPAAWARLMNDHRVSIWNSVPALLDMFLEHAGNHEDAVPACLRLALLSGDWLPQDIAARLTSHNPKARTISLGGATEASIWSIYHPVEKHLAGWSSVPYGVPLANQQFHVLDAKLRPRPLWVPGDLYIGGVGLAREYLGDAEKTRNAFITTPDGDRLYRTGDRGRLRPEGLIEFLGRIDTQVKVQGYRIELGEIEAALTARDEVGAALVEALGDPRGNRRLVAYVVPARDDDGGALDPSSDDLRTHLSQILPHYMVPSAFVFLEQFPLSPNGKVDRKALPQPDQLGVDNADITTARTPVERELAALWCELLNLEQVGIHDDLFELGANSLIAIRIAAAIKERLSVEIELRTLFEKATIAQVAQVVAHIRAEGGAEVAEALVLSPDPANRYAPFPLNDVQQAYLLGRQDAMELGSVAAHSYTELDSATLDPGRLEAIWRRLIEHHDMLRAVVGDDGRQRVMPFAALPPFEIPVQDLSALSETERQDRLDAWRGEMSHQVLPTDQWPLFDIRVSRLATHKIRIHYSFDLLIADAWSSQLLTLQFAYLYAQPEVRLEPPEIGFRDYVLAMESRESAPRYRKDRTYWRRRLDSLPGAPELPLAVDPNTLGRPNFVRRHAQLEPEDWSALKERCAGLGVTPSGLLMAAYAEVLGNWSATSRFCLNVTTFNRMPLHPQINEVVGDFTSLTLLEVHPSAPDTSFALRARQVQEQLWVDLDHRSYSGVEVIRDLGRARGQAMSALMPVVFTSRLFHDPRVAALAEEDFAYGEVVYSISQTPQVWIDAQVLEERGRLIWSWDTVDELFPEGLLEDIFNAHTHLLQRLAREPEMWEQSLLPITPAAHLALYESVNATELDLGPAARGTMDQLVAATVRRQPDDPAVVDPRRSLSYAALWQGACKLAHQLQRMGAQPNQLVAIIMDKGWEQTVAALGVQLAGAAYLPISPGWPEQRTGRVLEQGRVSLVISQPAVAEAAQWHNVEIICVDHTMLEGKDRAPAACAGPDDLAYVIFTSGSTGQPKGVAIEHAAAVNTLLDVNRRYQVQAEDRVLALSELTFDLSVFDLFGIWAAGGCLVLPPAEARRDPSIWGELGARHGVTLWNSVPALLDMMLTYAEGNPGALPPKLRLAMLSGDWLPVDIADRLHALQNGAQVVSMGGATEASIWSIFFPVPVPAPHWPSVPYGKPLANQTFHVLDARLCPRPLHTPGDLYIGGVGVAREYFGDPERTAASYITHPQSGARLYRTGDMGKYLPDGNIEFLGRLDNQVKVQGFRIELGEIEAALARVPQLAAAVAAAPFVGEGRDRRLVAYLVARPDSEAPDSEGMNAFLAQHLPEYMIPSAYIVLDHLPLTANGKVDRGALPDPSASSAAGISQAARTPAEQRMCGIWANLLDLESVGIDDNLFDLGGTSVTAIQLVSLIREEFGMELSMRTLFENLTVRALSLAMAQARAGGNVKLVNDLPTIVPDAANRYEPFPLNDIQQAYWVGRLGAFGMGSLGAHYYVEVDSKGLKLDDFSRAFRACIARHDALRLVFLPDGTQKILRDVPAYEVVAEDLREADEATRRERLTKTRDRLSHQVLPADQWPLFEVCATLIDADTTRLHLSFDLLLADAWSFQLLFRDMTALAANQGADLEPLELSFRDYVMGERQIAETERYRQSEDYWLSRIDSMPGAPKLPVKDSAILENPRFQRFDCGLSAADWARFQATASVAGITATGALMAAFAEVLGAWSSEPRFCLNVTMFNRQPLHPQVNMILGDFTSMTLVEVDTRPSGDDDHFALRARRIQERLWTDLDHGRFGGVKVLREMARRAGGAGAVTMPVVFTSRLFKIAGFDQQSASGDRIGEVVYSISQTPQVWIDHQITEQDGALCLNWDVVADLFPEGMIEAMFAAYQRLLDLLAASAENWETPLPALAPQSFDPLPAQTEPEPQHPLTLFTEWVKRTPNATALVADGLDGELRLSYRELSARAASIASRLKEQKLQAGDSVAVLLQRGWEQVAAVLGILAAGGRVVILDPNAPLGTFKTAMGLVHCRHLLSLTDRIEALGLNADVQVLTLDRLEITGSELQVPRFDPSAPAYASVNMGGDGQWLAVDHTHQSLTGQLAALHARASLSAEDRCLAIYHPAADIALYLMLAPLAAGARLILPKPGHELSPTYHQGRPAHREASVLMLEPGHLSLLQGPAPATSPRLILVHAEGMARAPYEQIRTELPGTRLLVLAGTVESGPWSLCFEGELPPESKTVPLGKPDHGHAFVLDARRQVRPPWVPGELFLAAPTGTYLNDPLRTAHRFVEVPDPLGGDALLRLFATGLLCRYLPDGTIEYLADGSQPVAKRRGTDRFGDMEALLRAHPGVNEAAVNILPAGESDPRRVVAYLTRAGEAGIPNDKTGMLGKAPDGAPPAIPELPEAPAIDARYRQYHCDPIYTPLERLQFKMEHHWRRRDLDSLPPTALDRPDNEAEELARFTNRRSRRRFTGQTVKRESLAQLLELLRVIQPKGLPLPKYRYPSGGGLYPVMVYLAVEAGGIEALDAGIYYYHPQQHQLHQLADEAVPHHWHAPENKAIIRDAAFTLFFIGRLSAVSPLYLDRGRDFCFLEAGYMGQLLMEAAPPELGLCPLGGLAFDPVRDSFKLEDTDLLVHLIVGGSVTPTTGSLADAFLAEQLNARDFEDMTQPKQVVTGKTDNDGPNWQMKPFEEPDWKQQAVFDPIARLQFKMEKKGIRKELEGGIALPATDIALLDPIYARRRSYRHFLAQTIPLAQFGRWLAALRSVQPEGMPLPKYRYPSGGGLYPVQTYLHLKEGAVEGLAKGVYYYDPLAHMLHLLDGGVDLPNELQGPPNRPIETEAAFSLMMVGKYGAVAPLYPALARDFCLLEAGYMGQLLEDTGTAHGIGVIPLGGMDFEVARPYFHLEEDCDLVHVFLGGAVSMEPQTLKEVFVEQNRPHGVVRAEVDDLVKRLAERLPGEQLPDRIVFLERLPKTAMGTIDRAALPDPDTTVEPELLAAPESQGERTVAEVWCTILSQEQVGIDQNFFEIGGTSVQMVQLHGLLQDAFSKAFPLVDLFEHSTVRTQAAYFDETTKGFDMDQAREQAAKRKAARGKRRKPRR